MTNDSFDELFPHSNKRSAQVPQTSAPSGRNDGGTYRRASSSTTHDTYRRASRTDTGASPHVAAARARQRTATAHDRYSRSAGYTSRTGRYADSAPVPDPIVDPEAHSPYQDQNRYRRIAKKPAQPRKRLISIVASVAVLAIIAVGAFAIVQSLPATITLNGSHVEVDGQKTIEDALRVSGIKPQPGDLVAVDGSVLEQGAGEPFHATINGTPTADYTAKLSSGDHVEIGNGAPIEEPSETQQEVIPFTVDEQGTGAIHLIEGQGTDGLKTVKVGLTSGLTAETVDQEASNIVRRNVSPDVGDDRVVALTFDDGPWSEYTTQVLDVLAKHGAKATFFTVGDRISGEGVDLVKRAAAEGHQICTHTFDHASGSGQSVNLGYMTPDEQVAEIERGYEAIEAATETEASHVVRTPGGNFGPEVSKNIGSLISAEIGWNIDSRDWEKPGAQAIADEIKGAWPGAIILMHDGGGDRSQTVEALKMALPYLKHQGYRFVTIDELMDYPLS